MRILHVIESMRRGGAERQLAASMRELAALGVENDLATLDPENAFADELTGCVRVQELAVFAEGRLRGIRRLARMAREVELVSTHLVRADIAGRVAAVLARKPVVSTLHCTWYSDAGRGLSSGRRAKMQAFRMADALTARLCRVLVAVSPAVREASARDLHLPASRIAVVPNGVDLQEFDLGLVRDREAVRRELGIGQAELMILAVARLDKQKDHATAVHAVSQLARYRPVRLLLAGTGPLEPELQALAGQTSAPVHFLGLRADVRQLLGACDCFLLPTFFEGFGMALLEAMAMGCACVCSDIPVTRYVGGDAVMYAPPGNAGALAEVLDKLLPDPELRSELGRRARQRARLFDIGASARAFLEVITPLVPPPQAAPQLSRGAPN